MCAFGLRQERPWVGVEVHGRREAIVLLKAHRIGIND